MKKQPKADEEKVNKWLKRLVSCLNAMPADVALWVSDDGGLYVLPVELDLTPFEFAMFDAGSVVEMRAIASDRALAARIRGIACV